MPIENTKEGEDVTRAELLLEEFRFFGLDSCGAYMRCLDDLGLLPEPVSGLYSICII